MSDTTAPTTGTATPPSTAAPAMAKAQRRLARVTAVQASRAKAAAERAEAIASGQVGSIFTPEAHAKHLQRLKSKYSPVARRQAAIDGTEPQHYGPRDDCPYCGATAADVADVKAGDLFLVRRNAKHVHRHVMRVLSRTDNGDGSVVLHFRADRDATGKPVPVSLTFPVIGKAHPQRRAKQTT